MQIRIAEKKLKRKLHKRDLKTDLHLLNEDIKKADQDLDLLKDIKKDQAAKEQDEIERLDPSIFSKCTRCNNVYLKNDKHICF